MFSIWNSSFSLQTVSYALLKCQYRVFHLALLESIFDCLDYSSNLIFTALSFLETGLESTEHVVGSGNIPEAIRNNTFQKYDDT